MGQVGGGRGGRTAEPCLRAQWVQEHWSSRTALKTRYSLTLTVLFRRNLNVCAFVCLRVQLRSLFLGR